MVTRRALDAYYTPDALAVRLVSLLPIGPDTRVWEPHAGGGAFVRALLATGAAVTVSDVDAAAPALQPDERTGQGASSVQDFLGYHAPAGALDWIVGNPPFGGFERHVDHALTCAPNVAFLLRLAAMESATRVDAWRRWPLRKVWVLAERPSFTDGGTDSAAYGWFWWQQGYAGGAEVVPGWSWKGGAA
jgi:hypothetical protein